jgi:hypothetical protein
MSKRKADEQVRLEYLARMQEVVSRPARTFSIADSPKSYGFSRSDAAEMPVPSFSQKADDARCRMASVSLLLLALALALLGVLALAAVAVVLDIWGAGCS